MLKIFFRKLVFVQKFFLILFVAGLIYGIFVFVNPVHKSVDCSLVPKMDNADVIRIENGQFNPASLTVKVCDTILFLNLDETEHWPKGEGFDAGHALPRLDYFQFQVTKTGTYSFNDHLHPDIQGKIIVEKAN